MAEMRYVDLGRRPFQEVRTLQRRLVRRGQQDPGQRPWLLAVEHDPGVITLGRSARSEHVLAGSDRLAEMGVRVHYLRRGGDATWHGPGQLVCYPIVRLHPRRGPIRNYISCLEEGLITALARLGLEAGRKPRLPGVWVGEEKVAAIGVAVDRWVAYHGLALNVGSDLSGFDLIVPCGLRQRHLTSLSDLLAREVTVEEVKEPAIRCLSRALGFQAVQTELPEFPRDGKDSAHSPQAAGLAEETAAAGR